MVYIGKKYWRQSECSSIRKWWNQEWHIPAMKYCEATQKNYRAILTNLEGLPRGSTK